MDRLKQIETFIAVVHKSSLTAAANEEGVAPAIIGRRLDALENRLGVKLLVRTTRRITLTHEGSAFLEDAQRIVRELNDAELSVAAGGVKASGHIRVTAPAGFGRKHVAPLVPEFLAAHPDVSLSLDLSDRVVDLINEGFDCAVRIGELPDSSLTLTRLADNRRVCVASPAYLKRHGVPQTPQDLQRHQCLAFASVASQPRGWVFQQDGGVVHLRVQGQMDCSDGETLADWCLQGLGLAWRSWWEVGALVGSGELATVLDEFAAPPTGIFAVMPQRKHTPLRVKLWVEYLKSRYALQTDWRAR